MKNSFIFVLICFAVIQLASVSVAGIGKDAKKKVKVRVHVLVSVSTRVELGAEEANEVNGVASSKIKPEVKEVVDEETDPMDEIPDESKKEAIEVVDEETDPMDEILDESKNEVKEAVDVGTDPIDDISGEQKEEVNDFVVEVTEAIDKIPAKKEVSTELISIDDDEQRVQGLLLKILTAGRQESAGLQESRYALFEHTIKAYHKDCFERVSKIIAESNRHNKDEQLARVKDLYEKHIKDYPKQNRQAILDGQIPEPISRNAGIAVNALCRQMFGFTL